MSDFVSLKVTYFFLKMMAWYDKELASLRLRGSLCFSEIRGLNPYFSLKVREKRA